MRSFKIAEIFVQTLHNFEIRKDQNYSYIIFKIRNLKIQRLKLKIKMVELQNFMIKNFQTIKLKIFKYGHSEIKKFKISKLYQNYRTNVEMLRKRNL